MSRTLDDTDDDLDLPQRSRRPDPREEIARDMSHDSDREFTLSTGTVLALFFGLALLCAVFFGFGYSIGHKSAKAATDAANASVPDPAAQAEATPANKPAAGAPTLPSIPGYQADPSAAPRTSVTPATKVTTSSDGTRVTIAAAGIPVPVKTGSTDAGAAASGAPVVRAAPNAVVPQNTPPIASSGDPGAVYVQIAAVSHQEDANVLLTALKRRGYSVFTRPSDSDKLIHVQVGPYSGKKDAEAMRQRLLGDGYNAILK